MRSPGGQVRRGESANYSRRRLLRDRAVILRDIDAKRALASAIELLLRADDSSVFHTMVTHHRDRFTSAVLDEVIVQQGYSESQRRRISSAHRKATQWRSSRLIETYEDHLRQIVTRCRASGAEPVLLTYPQTTEFVEQATAAIARELGTQRIAIHEEFAAMLYGLLSKHSRPS